MRRPLVLLSLLALSGCGLWGDKADERKRASDVYVRKGVAYMEAGSNEQARADLEKAIDLNSRNSEAHNALAVLYERLDKPNKAEAHYEKAVDLDDQNFAAKNNYSRFLCGHGKYEEGVAYLDQVLTSRLYAQPWLILTNKGICHKLAGKTNEAEVTLREALESQPGFAPALLELARLSFDDKNYLKARAFLQRYAGAADQTAETLWLAARTEQALGNQSAMQGFLSQLRERFPGSPEAAEARKLAPAAK